MSLSCLTPTGYRADASMETGCHPWLSPQRRCLYCRISSATTPEATWHINPWQCGPHWSLLRWPTGLTLVKYSHRVDVRGTPPNTVCPFPPSSSTPPWPRLLTERLIAMDVHMAPQAP
eukprot:XP_001690642.1 predicted protein [Chlamydomonas reinhardtii]